MRSLPKEPLLMLLLLALCLRVLRANRTECKEENRTFEVQLSSAHILRTWQPNGTDCSWWESRQSETNRFLPSVRSGPRWLVMQLRQPLMLEAVSVRGWDGQWRPAASVGSAFGAASLPLELQLEDPCGASWEAFNSSDRWRHLGTGGKATEKKPALTRYVLLVSSSKGDGLSWSGISLTVGASPLNLSIANNSQCPFRDLSAMADDMPVCFSVSSCEKPINCSFNLSSGSTLELEPLNRNTSHPVFEFRANSSLHGATLGCQLANRPAVRIEQTVGIVAKPNNVSLSVQPVWVRGRRVAVSFTSSAAYPAQRHRCFITSGGTNWSLDKNFTKVEATISKSHRNEPAVTVASQLRFTAAAAMLKGTLRCSSKPKMAIELDENTAVQSNEFHITHISEPCETLLNVSQIRLGIIWVASLKCSYWNVSHSCWISKPNGEVVQRLETTEQTGFRSTHRLGPLLNVNEQDLVIKCSVNQSGLVYPDVESALPYENKPQSTREPQSTWEFLCVILLIFTACCIITSCKLAQCYFKLRGASSVYESSQDDIGSQSFTSERFTASTMVSDRTHVQNHFVPSLVFATVTEVSDEPDTESDGLSTCDEENFTDAAGHYDLDGCTFVHYAS